MENTRYFLCVTCKSNEQMNVDQLKQHLNDVHQVDANDKTEGTRTMRSHMDAKDWFGSTYEWNVNGIILNEVVQVKRTKATRMF